MILHYEAPMYIILSKKSQGSHKCAYSTSKHRVIKH